MLVEKIRTCELYCNMLGCSRWKKFYDSIWRYFYDKNSKAA